MKLMWHIAWKDLRRLRWPIVVWLLLIVAKLGAGAFLVWSPTASVAVCDRVILAAKIFIFLEVLAGYLLTAELLHGDVVTDTKAFWRTRPISSGRLLGSKALGILIIFGALPVLVTLPWWWVSAYGVSDIGRAALETCGWEFAVVLVALPLAALTDGMPRFLIWSLVLFVSVICLGLMGIQMLSGSGELAGSRITVALAIFSLFFLASGIAVFWWRRWEPGSAVLASGLVLAALSLGVWPWTFGTKSVARPWPVGGALTSAIKINFDRATEARQKDNEKIIRVSFNYQGVPKGYFLGVTNRYEQEWVWKDGVRLERRQPGPEDMEIWPSATILESNTILPSSAWEALGIKATPINGQFRRDLDARWRKSHPGKSSRFTTESDETSGRVMASVQTSFSFADRMLKADSEYDFRSALYLKHVELSGRVRAVVGQAFTHERERERILEVQSHPDSLGMIVSVSKPQLGYRSWEIGIERPFWVEVNELGYALVNPEGTAIAFGRVFQPFVPVRIATVGIMRLKINFFSPGDYLGNFKFAPRPGWSTDATLVKINSKIVDTFTAEVRTSNFKLTSSTNPALQP